MRCCNLFLFLLKFAEASGGVRGFENGPAFVPVEICRIFRSAGDKFLRQYINMRTQRVSVLIRKRFTTPNWVKESILSTVLKLCLKSLLEFVRLHTFNRSGFQQIQLDIQFLRGSLKDTVDDEAAVDFLLDEVIVGVTERCLDPIPLEPPILEKLIQAKLAKTKAQSPTSF